MKSLFCLKNIFSLGRSEEIHLNWINFYYSILSSTDSNDLPKAEIKVSEFYILVIVWTEGIRCLSDTEVIQMGEINGFFTNSETYMHCYSENTAHILHLKSFYYCTYLDTLGESPHSCCKGLSERVEGKTKVLAGICTTLALAVPQLLCPSVLITEVVPLQ